MMLKTLIYFFICYGLANFFSYFNMAKPIREFMSTKSNFFGHLINCIYCCSFWIALLMSLVVFSPVNMLFGVPFLYFILDGFFVFGLTNIIFAIQNYIEKNTQYYE